MLVDELAVGHGDEQREHDTEMEREREAHRRSIAQRQQCEADGKSLILLM